LLFIDSKNFFDLNFKNPNTTSKLNKLKEKFTRAKSEKITINNNSNDASNLNEQKASRSMSLQDSNLSNNNYSFNSELNYNPTKIVNKDANWRVGLICTKDCYYILLEILKCLENMGYEWKLVSSSYKIKCRKKNEDQSSNSKGLNILIQIFGVSTYISSYSIYN
jgi:hypothetical protein